MKNLLIPFLFVVILLVLLGNVVVFAAENTLQMTFDPPSANYTAGQNSLVYLTVNAQADTISAATVTLSASGGITILDILSPVDVSNKPISDTKVINKKLSDTTASATILLIKNTADLPSAIKIPIVVTNGKGIMGKIKLHTNNSEIVNGSGRKYKMKDPSEAQISFSEKGQSNNPAPSPTSLPRNSMVLHISARLFGVDAATVKRKTLEQVTVQLVQKNGNSTRLSIPQYMTMKVNNDGIWQGSVVMTNVSAGNYQLLLKGPHHLQKKICEIKASETSPGKYQCTTYGLKLASGQNDVNITGITLMPGDVGLQDGLLNSYDLSFLQNAIRKTSSSTRQQTDMNMDGKVDKKDYDLVVYALINTSGLDQK